MNDGISLVDAAGYPISRQNDHRLLPGQHAFRTNSQIISDTSGADEPQKTFELDTIKISYQYDNRIYETTLEESFTIACVKDQQKVYSSIDKTSWSEKVINEDFNRLKQEVAADLKSGKKQRAMKRIDKYHEEQQAVNAVVGSARVAENLDKDLKELKPMSKKHFREHPKLCGKSKNPMPRPSNLKVTVVAASSPMDSASRN